MLDRRALAIVAVALFLSACNLRRPEVTLTLAPIETRTPEATAAPDRATATEILTVSPRATQSLTPLPAASDTPTPSVTPSPKPTETLTATETLSPTPSKTDELTATATPTATATETPTPTDRDTDEPAPTETATATDSATPTQTDTDVPTSTARPTATDSAVPTDTPQPTATESPEPSATETPLPTITETREPTATETPLPTSTNTPEPTSTDRPLPTATESPEPTASDPPTVTEAPTLTQTVAASATSTVTATASDLPTAPPSNTPRPSSTPTLEPSPTRILPEAPTETARPTSTPTDSILTSLPQRSAEEGPTETEETLTEVVPTYTALPTADDTEVAKLLATPEPRPTLVPTGTIIPTVPPPAATEVGDEDDPGEDRALAETALASTPVTLLETPRPTPTPTRFQPTVAVRRDLLQAVIQPIVPERSAFTISNPAVYEYNVGVGQVFTFENIQLQGGVRLFLPNPVDPSSFLRTDFKGMLRYKPIGTPQEGEMSYSPYFHGFSGGINSIEENKNRIAELDWSADGRQFSFRIDPPRGTDNANAGVWFWQPIVDATHGATFPIIRDCVAPGYKSCDLVARVGPWFWKTIGVEWSPSRGSNSVLLTLFLPDESRNALAIVQAVRDPNYANNAPQFHRYDYGHWHLDGSGITVSGRRPDGRVIIGAVNSGLQGEQVILDGSSRGLWLRDAVRLPNGQYVALGRPGGPRSGPVALYDQTGRQISAFVGNVAPEDVRWFPDRSAVVVSVQGRQHTLQVADRSISDTTDVTYNPVFGEAGSATSAIPDAVIAGSEYYPGQQLRILVDYLNVRAQPSTSSGIVGGLLQGDYVAVFAGPYDNEDYRWWQIQTADNAFGWIAGTINNAPTVASL